MSEPERGLFGWDERPADVVGRRLGENLVDDADPVEADHDRQPPGHRGRLITADVLEPPDVALNIGPRDRQRIETSSVHQRR
jgi:hypothetical protein